MSSYLPISKLPGEQGLAIGVAKPVAPPEPGDLVDMARQILDDELLAWQCAWQWAWQSRTGPTRTGISQRF